jgi:hypothetical protein
MIKKVLIDNDLIIAISDSFEEVENGLLVAGHIYPMGTIHDLDILDTVIPQKYKYNEKDRIHLNQQWAQSVDREKQEAIDGFAVNLVVDGILPEEKIVDLISAGKISSDVAEKIDAKAIVGEVISK